MRAGVARSDRFHRGMRMAQRDVVDNDFAPIFSSMVFPLVAGDSTRDTGRAVLTVIKQ